MPFILEAATGGVLEKAALKSFAKFSGKHLCRSLARVVFPVTLARFLRTPFLLNTSGRLLLLSHQVKCMKPFHDLKFFVANTIWNDVSADANNIQKRSFFEIWKSLVLELDFNEALRVKTAALLQNNSYNFLEYQGKDLRRRIWSNTFYRKIPKPKIPN